MSIAFQDFVPTFTKARSFLAAPDFEPLEQTLSRANAWIAEEGVTVINVETVVLPNMHSARESGSEDPDIVISGERSSRWYQFIRVWYSRG